MTSPKCCVCLENENWEGSMHCHICNEGTVCCHCYEKQTDYIGHDYIQCPVCRSLFISEIKRKIIVKALLYSDGIKTKNNLIRRWFDNYLTTDAFELMGQDVSF